MPAEPATSPFRFATFVPTVAVNLVAPILIFKTLEWLGVSALPALAGGCVAPALDNLRTWMTSRRLDPVGILMAASVVCGVVSSLGAGDASQRLVTDSLVNGAWGAAFLASMLFRRPLMFFLIRQLVAGEDPSRIEIWNGLWRHDVFRSATRSITVMWGLAYIAEVLIEAGLARALTPEAVVTISPLIGIGATLALIALTRRMMRAARKRLEVVEHVKWPL
jgi:hypothetical protein